MKEKPPVAKRRPFFRSLGIATLFLSFFIGASWAIHEAIEPLRAPGLAQKLDALTLSNGGTDLAFVGSSRVFRQFDPIAFDRELSTRGIRFRSYSLGNDSMRPPESLYVARQVLALASPPRWLLLELWDFFPLLHMEGGPSARGVSWHDAEHTAMALRHLARRGLSWRATGHQLTQHLSCFALNMTNLGRGVEWAEPEKRKKGHAPRLPKSLKEDPRRGFEPIDEPRFPPDEETAFREAVEKLRRERHVSPLSPVLRIELQELAEEAREIGVRLVFVVNPTVTDGDDLTNLEAQGIDVPVISFADPNRFPELYDPINHRDAYHLNSRGAAIYSRLLAEEFSILVNPREASRD